MKEDEIFNDALVKYRRIAKIPFITFAVVSLLGFSYWGWITLLIAGAIGFAVGKLYANQFYSNMCNQTGLNKGQVMLKMMEIDNKKRSGF